MIIKNDTTKRMLIGRYKTLYGKKKADMNNKNGVF